MTLVAASLTVPAHTAAAAPAVKADVSFTSLGYADAVGQGAATFRGHHYFVADDGVHGRELWRTDGTVAGTTLFADLTPGGATSHSTLSMLTVTGARLYFVQRISPNSYTSSYKLWSTTGNAAQPMIEHVSTTHAITLQGSSGDQVYYSTRFDVNESVRTFVLADGATLPIDVGVRAAPPIARIGADIYFEESSSQNLWRFNTVSKTSSLVYDPPAGAIYHLATTGGKLFFVARNTSNVSSVFISSGTPASTKVVKTVPHPQYPLSAGTSGGSVTGAITTTSSYFFKTSGLNLPDKALWAVSASTGKAVKILDRTHVEGWASHGSRLVVHNATLAGWVTNGTAAGTARVQLANRGYARQVFATPTRAYFLRDHDSTKASQGGKRQLWLYDYAKKCNAYFTDVFSPASIYGPIGKSFVYTTALSNGRLRLNFLNVSGAGKTHIVKKTLTVKKGKKNQAKITGKARVGRTLKAKAPKWSAKKVKVRYRWYVAGKAVKGATKRTFKLRKAHRGKKVRVQITGSKSGYTKRSVNAYIGPVKK